MRSSSRIGLQLIRYQPGSSVLVRRSSRCRLCPSAAALTSAASSSRSSGCASNATWLPISTEPDTRRGRGVVNGSADLTPAPTAKRRAASFAETMTPSRSALRIMSGAVCRSSSYRSRARRITRTKVTCTIPNVAIIVVPKSATANAMP